MGRSWTMTHCTIDRRHHWCLRSDRQKTASTGAGRESIPNLKDVDNSAEFQAVF